MYIVDSEYLYNYDKLVNDLIEEIKRDTIENREDKDIVCRNLSLLEKVYSKRNNSCLQNEYFVINELGLFGYEIVKFEDIKSNLITLRTYLKNIGKDLLSSDLEELYDKSIDAIKEVKIYE